MSDFAVGYILGQNAEASARSWEQAAANFGRILDRRREVAQEMTELSWCHARIAQLESCADYAGSAIAKLEADAEHSHKWAKWAADEINRLRAEGARLAARVREFEAAEDARQAGVLDSIRRALRDDGDDDDGDIPF